MITVIYVCDEWGCYVPLDMGDSTTDRSEAWYRCHEPSRVDWGGVGND